MKLSKLFSSLILLLAAILWGFAFVAQKAAATVPVFTLSASRSIIASVALVPIVITFDKLSKNGRMLFSKKGIDITKRELIGGGISGALLFVATVLQQAGIGGTEAGKASFITALYVVIVPVFALFLKKKSPLNAWIGVGISVIGFYLLCIKEGFTVATPDLLVFACAFVFAMQILTVDTVGTGTDGFRFSLIQFSTVSILATACALIFEGAESFLSVGDAIGEILYLGLCSSCVAYTLQIIGQKNAEPAAASIILSLESVFGAISSAIILGEILLPKEYIGAALVLVSVIVSQMDFSHFSRKKSE